MSSFTLFLKQYVKNKFLFIFSLFFFIIIIGKILYGIFLCSQMSSEPLDYLLQTLSVTIYIFIFFMFLANEYLFKIKQYDAEELLRSMKKGFRSYYFYGFSVLFLFAFFFTAVILIINLAVYFNLKINHPEYLLHVVCNILFNIFLISILGILLGGVLSLFKRRLVCYVLMIVVVFLSSPFFEIIATNIYAGTGRNIYPLYDFFNIFPPLLQWAPLQSFGYSLLPYRIELLFFWLLLCILILSAYILRQRIKKQAYLPVFCGIACIVCLIGYFQPSSKVTMSENPATGANTDARYYQDYAADTCQALFSIEQYILDIDINKQLNVKATLFLAPNSLATYDFTLYHGYKVDQITDADGQELAFSQAGDYFTVESKESLDQITLSYNGSSVKFFSNTQGASLPGWFAYYPRPGKTALFHNGQQSFRRLLCPSDTAFQVTVKSPKKIYCNLDGSHHSFSGKADGLTLVSGFYDTVCYDGIEIIYPYLASNEFTPDSIVTFVDEYLSEGIITKEQKKIFVLPNTNMTAVYERYCGFYDHMTVRQLLGLPMIFDMQKIPENKLSLYTAFENYKRDKEAYFDLVEFKRQEYQDIGEEPSNDIYILLDNKLKEFGDVWIEEKVETYLADVSDSKDEFAFLNALQK